MVCGGNFLKNPADQAPGFTQNGLRKTQTVGACEIQLSTFGWNLKEIRQFGFNCILPVPIVGLRSVVLRPPRFLGNIWLKQENREPNPGNSGRGR